MKNSIQEIQDKIFLAQDKIRWCEMFISHAKADLHELQELTMDMEEIEMIEKYSMNYARN